MVHVVFWYIIVLLIGWVAWPVCAFLFPAFRDKGYAFSRTLGLMLSGFFFWLLASFKVLQNDTGGVMASLILVLGISLILQYTGKIGSYADLFRSARKSIIWIEILFLVCFVLIALWRAANPDITGTEKPMELAFINAILRSPSFPPYDPWLSGYSISYYYFGYVIISMLIRLSGTTSGIAFNLMAATVFSLTAIGLYGMLFNLVNAPQVKKWLKAGDESESGSWYGIPLLGPLFTLIIGNFEGLFEVFYARGWFWQKAADGSWFSSLWKWVDLQELQSYPTQPLSWWPSRPGGIVWWRASRVLADYKLTGEFQEIIDEFPFFSFLLSDLHPHVLALPFDVLALAFGLNFLLGGAKGRISFWDLDLHFPLRYLLAVPVFIGGLVFMNTWDFPVQLGIFLLCMLAVRVREVGWSTHRIWELVTNGLVLGGLSVLCYAVFLIGFKSQAGGIVPSFIFHTKGIQLWMMFGTLLIPILIFLFSLIGQTHRYRNWLKGLLWSSVLLFGLWGFSFLLAAGALNMTVWGQGLSESPVPAVVSLGARLIEGGTQFSSVQGLDGETTLSAMGAAIGNRIQSPGAWLTLWLVFWLGFSLLFKFALKTGSRNHSADDLSIENVVDDSHLPDGIVFILILVLCGGLVILIPEFIYLQDQFGNRMNTIFKFYYQGWLFWSFAAAFGVVYIIHRLKGIKLWVTEAIITLVVLIGLIYPLIGTSSTTNAYHPDKLNLDGTAYLKVWQTDDAEAMDWLREAPYGVVAESVGGSYSAHARMSIHSGQPTVIGWTPHEGQWGRTYKEMGTRDQDIATLYQTPDWQEALNILDKYQIRYIVVGNLEKSTYTHDSVTLNENKFQQYLPTVFSNNSVVIYEYPGSVYETQ
jgi:YYY domain-containing protein